MFSAVLLDLMLPTNTIGELKLDPALAENGVDLLRRIRQGDFAQKGTPQDVPVFVMSGLGPEVIELLNRVRQMSVKDIFGKPAPPILVAESIRICLEGANDT